MDNINIELNDTIAQLVDTQSYLHKFKHLINQQDTTNRLELCHKLMCMKETQKTLDDFIDKIKDSTDLDDAVQSYQEMWEEAKSQEYDLTRTKEYNVMKQKLQNINTGPPATLGAGAEAAEEPNLFLDPWTGRVMQKPHINKNCGHTYDRKSVETQLRANRNLTCPVAHCINMDPITLEDLELNIEMMHALQSQENHSSS